MPHLVASIDIDAPRAHVFNLAGDVSRQPEWTTFIKEAVITSGDGRSEGTTERTVIKVGPRPHSIEGTWVEFTDGEALARRFTGYMRMRDRLTVASIDRGTRVEWTVDYTPPFGAVGRFMAWFLMSRIFQNEIEASLENLKRALED